MVVGTVGCVCVIDCDDSCGDVMVMCVCVCVAGGGGVG